MNTNHAFNSGMAAARRGLLIEFNPYERNSELWFAWNSGFNSVVKWNNE